MKEVEAWTVAIPNLPLLPNKKVRKFMTFISEMEGFYGVHPHYPEGTLLLFDSENNAKRARNQIRCYEGYNGAVGNNICKCWIPEPKGGD